MENHTANEHKEVNFDGIQEKILKAFTIIALVAIVLTLSLVITKLIIGQKEYVLKNDIQNKLIIAINNNASLDVIKTIYNNRVIESVGLTGRDDYYKYNQSLLLILKDIQTNFYLQSESSIDINKTNEIISHYQAKNPYDALESSQKDMFINIQQKLDYNQYVLIQGDLEKVAKEMEQKNNLVSEYLNDSTLSFWISIIALGFSVLIGIYQLILARDSRVKKIVLDALHDN